MRVKLLLALTILTMLSGCSYTRLHAITGEDLIPLEKGETVTAPKRGFFVSDYYLTSIVRAKNE